MKNLGMMVTKQDFMSYYEAQMSGEFNMVMDAHKVMSEYGIDKDVYWEIIRNYDEYYNEYIK